MPKLMRQRRDFRSAARTWSAASRYSRKTSIALDMAISPDASHPRGPGRFRLRSNPRPDCFRHGPTCRASTPRAQLRAVAISGLDSPQRLLFLDERRRRFQAIAWSRPRETMCAAPGPKCSPGSRSIPDARSCGDRHARARPQRSSVAFVSSAHRSRACSHPLAAVKRPALRRAATLGCVEFARREPLLTTPLDSVVPALGDHQVRMRVVRRDRHRHGRRGSPSCRAAARSPSAPAANACAQRQPGLRDERSRGSAKSALRYKAAVRAALKRSAASQ